MSSSAPCSSYASSIGTRYCAAHLEPTAHRIPCRQRRQSATPRDRPRQRSSCRSTNSVVSLPRAPAATPAALAQGGHGNGLTKLIRYQGAPVKKLRRSWGTVAKLAAERESKRMGKKVVARATKDGPHIMRHSCCTWLMAAGVDVHEVSGYTGVSVEVLLEVYGHHHTDIQSNAATATGERPRAAGPAHENGGMIAELLT